MRRLGWLALLSVWLAVPASAWAQTTCTCANAAGSGTLNDAGQTATLSCGAWSADDILIIQNGCEITTTPPLTWDATAGRQIEIESGGIWDIDTGDDGATITLPDGIGGIAVDAQAGSTFDVNGRCHQWGVQTPTAQDDCDSANTLWPVGDWAACPGGDGDCNGTGNVSLIRFSYPAATYNTHDGQPGESFLDESFASLDGSGYWWCSASDKANPDGPFCHPIAAVDFTGPDYSLDINTDAGLEDANGYPLDRRRPMQATTNGAITNGEDTVVIDCDAADAVQTSCVADDDGDGTYVGYFVHFLDANDNHLFNPMVIAETSHAGDDLTVRLSDDDGVPVDVADATKVIIEYTGMMPGKLGRVLAPVHWTSATAAIPDSQVKVFGNVRIKMAIFDAIGRPAGVGGEGCLNIEGATYLETLEDGHIRSCGDAVAGDSGRMLAINGCGAGAQPVNLRRWSVSVDEAGATATEHGIAIEGCPVGLLEDIGGRFIGDDPILIRPDAGESCGHWMRAHNGFVSDNPTSAGTLTANSGNSVQCLVTGFVDKNGSSDGNLAADFGTDQAIITDSAWLGQDGELVALGTNSEMHHFHDIYYDSSKTVADASNYSVLPAWVYGGVFKNLDTANFGGSLGLCFNARTHVWRDVFVHHNTFGLDPACDFDAGQSPAVGTIMIDNLGLWDNAVTGDPDHKIFSASNVVMSEFVFNRISAVWSRGFAIGTLREYFATGGNNYSGTISNHAVVGVENGSHASEAAFRGGALAYDDMTLTRLCLFENRLDFVTAASAGEPTETQRGQPPRFIDLARGHIDQHPDSPCAGIGTNAAGLTEQTWSLDMLYLNPENTAGKTLKIRESSSFTGPVPVPGGNRPPFVSN